METGWLSLLPVIIAIILSFTIRNVFLSLTSAILTSGAILFMKGYDVFHGINSIAGVFSQEYAVKSVLFCLMIGAFVHIIEASGGVDGMVFYLTGKKQVIRSKKGAQLLAYLTGLLMFIDATSSVVVTGVTSRPIFDHFSIPRKKLSYIADSTSSPIAWLMPFNAAGAFLTAMIGAQVSNGTIEGDPMSVIISTIPFQLYAIVSVIMVAAVILFGKSDRDGEDNRGIQKASQEDHDIENPAKKPARIQNFAVPMILFLSSVFGLIFSGSDASSAIYVGVMATLIISGIYYYMNGTCNISEYSEWVVEGMKSYFSVTVILVMAFAFSSLVTELGTGRYIASISSGANPSFIPVVIFIIGAIMSFATGTSAGTIGVLIPIVFPMASTLGIAVPVVLGAVISGGIFGDHCSPISDSTILSSMVAEVNVMEHVDNQMPYALASAAISGIGFMIIGALS